ncbi:MAG TPA: hypothetical protein VD931_19515 [Baekduia sp.]|nr:hypothetical protein [Baekduia sp.]
MSASNGVGPASNELAEFLEPDDIRVLRETSPLLAARVERIVRGSGVEPFDDIRGMLALPNLTRIVEIGRGQAYDFHLGEGPSAIVVTITPGSRLLNFRALKAAFFEQARHVIPPMKQDTVDGLCVTIASIAERAETSDDQEEILEWLDGYLRTSFMARTEAMAEGSPFIEDGRAFLTVAGFLQHVRRSVGEAVTRAHLMGWLRRLEFEPQQLSVRQGDTVRKRRYWRSPSDLADVHGWGARSDVPNVPITYANREGNSGRGQWGHGDTRAFKPDVAVHETRTEWATGGDTPDGEEFCR